MPHPTSIRTAARRALPLCAAALAATAGSAIAATVVQDGSYRGKTSYHPEDPHNLAGIGVQHHKVVGASMSTTRTCRKRNGHVDRSTSGGRGIVSGGFDPPLRIGASGRFNGTGRYTRKGRRSRHGRTHIQFKGRFVGDSASGTFALQYKFGSGKSRLKCKVKRVHWHVTFQGG